MKLRGWPITDETLAQLSSGIKYLAHLGDIAVFWRGSKEGQEGHVGLYISETPNFVYVLGGNQLDQVNISKISKAKLLDYRQIPKV